MIRSSSTAAAAVATTTCFRCIAASSSRSKPTFPSLPTTHLSARYHYISTTTTTTRTGTKGKQVQSPRWRETSLLDLRRQEARRREFSTTSSSFAAATSTKDGPRTSNSNKRRSSIPFFTSSPSSSTTTPSTFVDVPETLSPPSTSPLIPALTPLPSPLPPTTLSNGFPNPSIRWRPRPVSSTIREDLAAYETLGKLRLSMFVVLTTMAGYTICPVDPDVIITGGESMEILANSLLPQGTTLSSLAAPTSPSSSIDSLSPLSTNSHSLTTLLPLVVGTSLSAFSSAAFNEVLEAPYDAQMARTRNRPVPKRTLSPLHATTFGVLTGTVGLGTLYTINPLCALISFSTIILYCPIYTIMKRHTIYNTWLGAIVGSLPPLIGWAACTGSLDPTNGNLGGWAMFALLYFWQFPHFNALSHNIKSSYAASGYRMLSVLNPTKNALVSFRYALAIIPLSFAFPVLGLTNVYFPWVALAPNGLLALAAFRFWRERSSRSASWCFWASLVQLPVTLALAMLMKKGLWDGYLGGEEEKVLVAAAAAAAGKEEEVDEQKAVAVV